VVAYGDTRWEGKECGGGGVPDIAGEVGSGGDNLEGLKRDPIFDTQESQA